MLLALPLLVGGLLAMHGLAGGSSVMSSAVAHEASDVGHPGTADVRHEGDCAHCHLGHVMVACVAVLAAVATIAKACRTREHAGLPARPPLTLGWARGWTQRAHPPEPPAWVRLQVMLA